MLTLRFSTPLKCHPSEAYRKTVFYASLPSSCSVRKMWTGKVIDSVSCFTKVMWKWKQIKGLWSVWWDVDEDSQGDEPGDVISRIRLSFHFEWRFIFMPSFLWLWGCGSSTRNWFRGRAAAWSTGNFTKWKNKSYFYSAPQSTVGFSFFKDDVKVVHAAQKKPDTFM